MEKHNSDLFPGRETLELYSTIAPLIQNPIVDEPFKIREASALRAKHSYHFQGRVGMLLIVISSLFTLAEALVLPPFAGRAVAGIAMIVFGVAGMAIQVRLLLVRRKQDWLLNRFAAERLRSIKFQAFPLADSAVDVNDLQRVVNEFYARETTRLAAEMNARDAALALFSPKAAVQILKSPKKPVNDALGTKARDAYRELRIAYQLRFAADEVASLRRRQRVSFATADLLFIGGTMLILFALFCRMTLPELSALSRWLDFLALSAFVLGLANSLFENASLTETSQTRYEHYIRELSDADRDLSEEEASLVQAVSVIEGLALDELEQFCLEASKITYRI